MGFRLLRASDYPPELHKATDRFESAVDAVARAIDADALLAALAEREAAEKAVGVLLLRLDRQRRPGTALAR